LAEFFVADQTAFADGGLLNRGEYGAALFGRDGEAEFLAFEVDAVETALLAENDAAVGRS
jgi:hypothetical protein